MELVVNNDEQMKAGMMAAPGKSGRVNAADFDSAELRAGPTLGQGLYLIVSGPAPKPGANVRLLPVLGDPEPEYRKIELAWKRTRQMTMMFRWGSNVMRNQCRSLACQVQRALNLLAPTAPRSST